jgi:hypothetical protein
MNEQDKDRGSHLRRALKQRGLRLEHCDDPSHLQAAETPHSASCRGLYRITDAEDIDNIIVTGLE